MDRRSSLALASRPHFRARGSGRDHRSRQQREPGASARRATRGRRITRGAAPRGRPRARRRFVLQGSRRRAGGADRYADEPFGARPGSAASHAERSSWRAIMKFSPETLMAYADGELDAETRRAIEAEMAVDPQVAQEVERHRAMRAEVGGAFAGVLDEPVPDRL